MKEHIIEILHQTEQQYDIKILYACEAGSRTWGIVSPDSDFDIRFIYIHKKDWYLSIDQKRDVLEIPKHDQVDCPVDPLIDMSGWELTKALRLFRKSNPGLLEWLHSGIIYIQKYSFLEKMHQLETSIFSPIPCIYHYVKMAKGNYKTLQEKGPNSKIYINIIRPLLMAKFIETNKCMGNLNLYHLIQELIPNGEIKKIIENIIHLKSSGQKAINQSIELDRYIKNELDNIEENALTLQTKLHNPTKELDIFFRKTLAKVWDK
ncbi:nucleotidyltransferase domain-containing protein [Bacillus nitroreducens]